MAQYTIEDIEILRQKSGIGYEEAVNLLEYHNGSLARALVDLEKNGRIRDSKTASTVHSGHRGRNLFDALYRFRIRTSKGDTTVVNLSALFLIFALLAAPWVVVFGALISLVLGYRIAVERNSPEFSRETLESIMKNAGNNVRNTVTSFARDLNAKSQPNASKDDAQARPAEPEKRSESPASGTTPVNVPFSEDGSVRVTETRDGYHEAEIR